MNNSNFSFDEAVDFVFKKEGFYSKDKHDPGGETKYGISQKAYPNIKIKDLTLEQAKNIYRTDYWNRLQCNNHKPSMALALFDTGVHLGVGRAIQLVKKLINKEDWELLLDHREAYYDNLIKKNPVLIKYKNGWNNRLRDLNIYCSKLDT